MNSVIRAIDSMMTIEPNKAIPVAISPIVAVNIRIPVARVLTDFVKMSTFSIRSFVMPLVKALIKPEIL